MVLTDDKVRKDIKNLITILTDLDEEVKELKNEVQSIKKNFDGENIKNEIEKTGRNIEGFLDTLEIDGINRNDNLVIEINEGDENPAPVDQSTIIYIESVIQPYIKHQVKQELNKALTSINNKFTVIEDTISNLRKAIVVNR